MKQKIYTLGLITSMVIITGTLFKVNHFPGAGILLTLGTFLLVIIFLPIALTNHYRNLGNKQHQSLYLVTWLTCFVVFTSMLFKLMHWPFAGTLLLISLPFPFVIFLPVFIGVTSKIENFNVYNTVIVLFILVSMSVFSALLALGVSRDRIVDSVALADNYNRLETNLKSMPLSPDNESSKTLLLKADELLKVVNDCQNRLFLAADITEEQWKSDPMVGYLDSRQIAARAFLKTKNEPQPAVILENGLKGFVKDLDEMPGYKELAKLANKLFELDNPYVDSREWEYRMFATNYLAWVLIYLDAVETDIYIIKSMIVNQGN